MHMNKVVMITNIPSPYRVDLFYYIQTHIHDFEFYVIYTNKSEDNRQWNVQEEKLLNTYILESKILKIRNKLDTRYIHLPSNIGKVLNEIRPDVVIAFEYNPAALQGLAWCRLHGKKFIHLTDGTLHSERNINVVQKFTRKIICSSADACIASSTKAKEKLLAWGVREEKIFISLLTVDISQYKKIERAPVQGRILYVGRITRGKGLDLLMNALQYVKRDFKLHVVGDGDEALVTELKAMSESLGLSDKIVWCGYKSGQELEDEYKHAQVFVLPTRDDCFGLVMLEAMCLGIPLVSSRYADGAYDLVIDGENGFIEDPYYPEKFAKAIENVLWEQSDFLIKNERHLERFSFKNVTSGYIDAVAYVLETEEK